MGVSGAAGGTQGLGPGCWGGALGWTIEVIRWQSAKTVSEDMLLVGSLPCFLCVGLEWAAGKAAQVAGVGASGGEVTAPWTMGSGVRLEWSIGAWGRGDLVAATHSV